MSHPTLRTSFYNVLVPVPENEEYLLYNTFSGGIEVLSDAEGRFLAEVEALDAFQAANYPAAGETIDLLLRKHYLESTAVTSIEAAEDVYLQNKTATGQVQNIGLTIGTTIICNMGCPYCFESVKPNLTLKDPEVIASIVSYLRDMLTKDPEIRWGQLNVTWYGGEPMINMKGILALSPILRELTREFGIGYEADIITNGIYLDPDNAQLLIDNGITRAQITIDGAGEVHDRKRPLKNSSTFNYYQILENIATLPEGLHVHIRMNTDREVAESAPTLLDDLAAYGIWPQRYRSVSIKPAWLRTYDTEDLTPEEARKRLTVDEFFDFYQDFRLMLIERFNAHAAESGLGAARLEFDLPKYQSDCPTWVSPYSLVIDPLGNVHKCWETIHDEKKAATTVRQAYRREDYDQYTAFNRFRHNEVCRNCKFLPVCDQISCSHQAIHHTIPQCTHWKYKTEDFLRSQYLGMLRRPDLVAAPVNADGVNTGHSNK